MKKDVKLIADFYGKEAQTKKATEELGELIAALARGDVSEITQELADVEVMLSQIKYLYQLDKQLIKDIKQFKIFRTIDGFSEPLEVFDQPLD